MGGDKVMDRAADMAAIGQVMATYCRGVDRLDVILLERVFWPESFDDHGVFKGGRDEFLKWVIPSMRDNYSATSFMLGQSFYEFQENRAAVETLFSARGWGLGGNHELSSTLCGRYVDLFEKRGHEWRVLHRTVIYDGAMTGPVLPLDFPHVKGSRSRDDESYFTLKKRPLASEPAAQ